MNQHNTLKLANVTKSFNLDKTKHVVLNNISVEFEQGLSYAITGPSGAGKSTLLSLLAGLELPTKGSLFFNEKLVQSIITSEPGHFFHRIIGIVFQKPYLIAELSVLENIILKGLYAGIPFTTCTKKGLELLEHVGLVHKAYERPVTLSGGEQQRVAIVRALFLEPLFLIADEPTAHLDVHQKENILSILCAYKRTLSMGLIVSSHDLSVAHYMDEQFSLHDGSLVSTRKQHVAYDNKTIYS